MAREFTVQDVPSQPALAVRVTCPRSEIGQQLHVILPRVAQSAGRRGAGPAGAPFARYVGHEAGNVEMEAGFPTTSPQQADGDIHPITLGGCKAARLTYMGHYDGLSAFWDQVMGDLPAAGWSVAGPPWEVYVTDPGAEPDPGKWITEIYVPVRKAQ